MADTVAEHVGRALRTRREALGYTLRDMIHFKPEAAALDLRWTENAPAPSTIRIRYYDSILRSLAVADGRWGTVPYAQREQWYYTALDDALWHEAMRHGRSRAWWWGASKARGQTGAWCYLCENMVHTYDAGRPMTHTARCAIMAHRVKHPIAGIAPAALPEGTLIP